MPVTSDREPDLVSVIIPTYNRAGFVGAAVESVRRQTWRRTQILVIDDGSTDDTRSLFVDAPDVLYLRQENRGQASARNLGLAHARGEFICSLDSDDVWLPEFLERAIGALRRHDAAFVFANWVGIDRDGKIQPGYFEAYYRWWDFPRADGDRWRLMTAAQARAMYLDSCISPSSSLVLRRDIVGDGWTRGLGIADDWCLLLDAVIDRSCRVAFTMERLWLKRALGDNLYDQRDHAEVKRILHLDDSHFLYKRFASRLTPAERARFFGHFAFHHFGMTKLAGRGGQVGEALRHAGLSLRYLMGGLTTSWPDARVKICSSSPRLRAPHTVPGDQVTLEGLHAPLGTTVDRGLS